MSEEKAYYRPVTIVGLLLVGEAFVLGGVVAYQLSRAREELLAGEWSEKLEGLLSGGAEGEASAVAVLFAVPAVLMLASGLWFLLRRRGWVIASVSQGLGLGACLLLYYGIAPLFIYPVMAYCVLTIMYLNSRDVRTIMHASRRAWTGGAGS